MFDCARQQQNNAQEQDRYDHIRPLPKPDRTSDYMRIVPVRSVRVIRLKGSIAAVLRTGTSVLARGAGHGAAGGKGGEHGDGQ